MQQKDLLIDKWNVLFLAAIDEEYKEISKSLNSKFISKT